MDFSWLTSWIVSVIDLFIGLIYNTFVKFINIFIYDLVAVAKVIVNSMPSIDVVSTPSIETSLIPYINWFLPVSGLVISLNFYFAGLFLYLISAPLLRWFKIVK